MSFALRSASSRLTPIAAIVKTLVIAWHDWMIASGGVCNDAVAGAGAVAPSSSTCTVRVSSFSDSSRSATSTDSAGKLSRLQPGFWSGTHDQTTRLRRLALRGNRRTSVSSRRGERCSSCSWGRFRLREVRSWARSARTSTLSRPPANGCCGRAQTDAHTCVKLTRSLVQSRTTEVQTLKKARFQIGP